MNIVVHDIDGGAVHTVAEGDSKVVMSQFPHGHPVRDLIRHVVASGKSQTRTYQIAGKSYTTRVVID